MKKAAIHLAPPYDDALIRSVKEHFDALYGETLEYNIVEDASVIGGFIAYIDGTAYDVSLANRLLSLAESMTRNEVDS